MDNELRSKLESRLTTLRQERSDLAARIDEIELWLMSDNPGPGAGIYSIRILPAIQASESNIYETGNGHKSTTDPDAFGINPYKDYSTKQVLAIFKGDTVEWRNRMKTARAKKLLPFRTEGRGLFYKGEDLIRRRQGLEKK